MQSPSRFPLHTTNYACLICRVVLCRHLAHTKTTAALYHSLWHNTANDKIRYFILRLPHKSNGCLNEKETPIPCSWVWAFANLFFLFNYLHCTAAPHWKITSTGRWMHYAGECLRLPYPCQRALSPSGPRRVSCTRYGQRCTGRARWSGVRASCPPR